MRHENLTLIAEHQVPPAGQFAQARGAANTKAKKELGWNPRYPTWREGFRAIGA